MKLKTIAWSSCLLIMLSGSACKKCKDCESKITTTKKEQGKADSVGVYIKNEGELCDEDLKSVDGKTFYSTASSGKATFETKKETSCK